MCRRKFNPNNYHGNWTEEEEKILEGLVSVHGHSWKAISEKMIEHGARERTPGNIKDKYKQMGYQSAAPRDLGPWSLEEGVNLFENVCTATGVEAMRKSMKLVIVSDAKQSKRYEVDEDEGQLRIYD